jgi:hypothetical protein
MRSAQAAAQRAPESFSGNKIYSDRSRHGAASDHSPASELGSTPARHFRAAEVGYIRIAPLRDFRRNFNGMRFTAQTRGPYSRTSTHPTVKHFSRPIRCNCPSLLPVL